MTNNEDDSQDFDYEYYESRRINRTTYILRTLPSILIILAAFIYLRVNITSNDETTLVIAVASLAASAASILICGLVIVFATIKRLRDVGLSPLAIILIFFPPLFGILLLALAIFPRDTFES